MSLAVYQAVTLKALCLETYCELLAWWWSVVRYGRVGTSPQSTLTHVIASIFMVSVAYDHFLCNPIMLLPYMGVYERRRDMIVLDNKCDLAIIH